MEINEVFKDNFLTSEHLEELFCLYYDHKIQYMDIQVINYI